MERIEIEPKKDRIEINKIIENSLPLIKLNKQQTQNCADAILLYLIDKPSSYEKAKETLRNLRRYSPLA